MITAHVTDLEGAPLAAKSVTVSTNRGVLVEANPSTPTAVDLTTDAQGTAQCHLRSETTVAVATIIATCEGVAGQTQVIFASGELGIYIAGMNIDTNGLLALQYIIQAADTEPDSVSILVDGRVAWQLPVSEGTMFNYDTTQLSNGSHNMQVILYATGADSDTTETATDSTTFTTDKLIYDYQVPLVATGVEPVTASFRETCDWILTFEEGGDTVHTASGTGTSMSYLWSGYGYGGTKVTLQATVSGGMLQSASSSSASGRVYSWYLGGVDTGVWCVHYGADDRSPGNEAFFRQDAEYVRDKLRANPHYGEMIDPFLFLRWGTESMILFIRDNILHPDYWLEEGLRPDLFYFDGHGDILPSSGEGQTESFVNDPTFKIVGLQAFHDHLGSVLRLHNLGPAIGNDVGYDMTTGRCYYAHMSRRFKFVMINACESALGLLHLAFGMPNGRYVGHGSAYLGHLTPTTMGASQGFSMKVWDYLEDGLEVHAAAEYAKQDLINAHPGDPNWVINYDIYGDPSLRLW